MDRDLNNEQMKIHLNCAWSCCVIVKFQSSSKLKLVRQLERIEL